MATDNSGGIQVWKCEDRSGTWTELPARFDGDALTVDLDSFSWIDVVVSWFRKDPTSEANVRRQASAWRPLGDADQWLDKRPFLDQKAFPGTITPLPCTFRDAVRALLLAEAQWEAIRDGNFYEGISFVEASMKTWIESLPWDVAERLLGLPSLGAVVKLSSFVIEATLKYLIENLGAAATNNQLRCYLSWRGWFYLRGEKRWIYKAEYANSHDTVMNAPTIPRSDAGWFLYYQKPDGTPGALGYKPTVPPNKSPGDLFRLGNLLCDLLSKVQTNEDLPWESQTLNGLEADRSRLSRAFRGANRPPAVTVSPPTTEATVGQRVRLRGECSDFEDDPVVYRWVQISGPKVELAYPTSSTTWFTPIEPGDYAFRWETWDHLLLDDRPSSAISTVRAAGDCLLVVHPGESIQSAVNAAPDGALICVSRGTWRENIVITKSITLRGAGRGATTLRSASDTRPVLDVKGDTPIRVKVEATTITDSQCEGGIRVAGAASLDLTECTISNNRPYGVGVFVPAQALIQRCTITGNEAYGILVGSYASSPQALRASLTVTACLVTNNRGQGTGYGIWLNGPVEAHFTSCTITNNHAGVLLRTPGPVSIARCDISANDLLGVIVLGNLPDTTGSRVSITDNRIVGNSTGGVILYGKVDLTIDANQVLSNGRYGVFLAERPCVDVDEVFAGYITGKGNTIRHNKLADVCPPELSFLMTSQGGHLERRR